MANDTPHFSAEFPVGWWHELPDGRYQCDLCPRACKLNDGQRGLCFVRARLGDQMVLTTYGRSSGFCIDPIEKKPLNHFYPGTSILSMGTAGCNLTCTFCQNHSISKSREIETLSQEATPLTIAKAAKARGCKSVAYTYNDPIIFAEYAIDTAHACRELGIKSVAVTAGYICAEPRESFFAPMDAANVDLKGFTESFYKKLCTGQLGAVLETLTYLVNETDCWVEITTLLIPGENDSNQEIDAMTSWIVEHLGCHVPLHFTAFRPQYRMLDRNNTPHQTLNRARKIALKNGLKYVYVGNVSDPTSASTYCPGCNAPLIVRDRHQILDFNVTKQGRCIHCQHPIPGRFDTGLGNWAGNRARVRLSA